MGQMGSSRRGTGELVAEAVAERETVDPVELTPPLYTAIDVDALETLIAHESARAGGTGIRVEFSYRGYDIAVEDGGAVEVRNR